MTLPAYMADSIEPQLIPARFRRNPNGVLAYHDGPHAWPEEQVRRFPNVWRISVTAALSSAPHARCLDVERYDATPDSVAGYQADRAARGASTTVYCSRDTVPLVIRADPDHWSELDWFIATLDNDLDWTPALMSRWLSDHLDVAVPPDRIRAIQNVPGENYDTSRVFGPPGWAHP